MIFVVLVSNHLSWSFSSLFDLLSISDTEELLVLHCMFCSVQSRREHMGIYQKRYSTALLPLLQHSQA